jgi:hypothetical protein
VLGCEHNRIRRIATTLSRDPRYESGFNDKVPECIKVTLVG